MEFRSLDERLGYPKGHEVVDLCHDVTKEQGVAIRAILDGRSVIYRCGVVGGKIRTTSGPTIIGNTFDQTQINDDPLYVGNNTFTDCKIYSTGAITRNMFA